VELRTCRLCVICATGPATDWHNGWMQHLKIDFVSDIACPWCAVGLSSLEKALQDVQGEITAELHFQPFELNPHMGPQGQDVSEHLTEKYGSTPEQQAQMREVIRQRGAEVGFTFKPEGRSRVWNTFDAHRLLHWAGETSEHQHALKKALLQAFFTHDRCTASHEVLVDVAASVGLDAARAQEILSSDTYTAEVRAQQQFYLQAGIHSVPAVIINERHLISGGQPADVFARALRQISANAANDTQLA
jgi:predicted DsbA family dithiol-disulfide isomerase